jgi:hypothetical protein
MKTQVETIAHSGPAASAPAASTSKAGSARGSGWRGVALVLGLALAALVLGVSLGSLILFGDLRLWQKRELAPDMTEHAQGEPAVPASNRLPKGKVELVAISEHPSQGKGWWKPDGTRFEEAPFENSGQQCARRPGTAGTRVCLPV